MTMPSDVDRYKRMLTVGMRAGRLPEEARKRVMELYTKLAGGWSWESSSKPLTDQDLDVLEAAIGAAERGDPVQ